MEKTGGLFRGSLLHSSFCGKTAFDTSEEKGTGIFCLSETPKVSDRRIIKKQKKGSSAGDDMSGASGVLSFLHFWRFGNASLRRKGAGKRAVTKSLCHT
ncbi:hypothetical protein [uncultured Neglectibacter sp.]|uniref:hypothetical protein n=1 Tax=uncultured Neglectibacter sp. TaxID=1924108 RepID=UPI0034DEE75A